MGLSRVVLGLGRWWNSVLFVDDSSRVREAVRYDGRTAVAGQPAGTKAVPQCRISDDVAKRGRLQRPVLAQLHVSAGKDEHACARLCSQSETRMFAKGIHYADRFFRLTPTLSPGRTS